MKISELAAQTGVSPASIKYYAREGLIEPGERTSANQTLYNERHTHRLRLIRALIEEADLTIADVRGVMRAIDNTDLPLSKMLGAAQQAVSQAGNPPSDAAIARVRATIDEQGWLVSDENPGLARCAAVLDRFTELGREDMVWLLDQHAAPAAIMAQTDINALPSVNAGAAREELAETLVIGGYLGDTIISGLRQMAQESISRSRFGRPQPGTPVPNAPPTA